MTDALLDLRDLFNLARALRRFAWQPDYEGHRDLFLDTAAVLEARAFFIATGGDLAPNQEQPRQAQRHTAVNVLA